jgi:hypothetical protein
LLETPGRNPRQNVDPSAVPALQQPKSPAHALEPRMTAEVHLLAESPPSLAGPLAAFAPIGLDELDAVALLDRRDTKFVLSRLQVVAALGLVANAYRILEIGGRRRHRYRTLYFDTPNFDLFRAHHRDEPERFKVRSREYVDTGLAFFELKQRTRTGRTVKSRLCRERATTVLGPEEERFLDGNQAFLAGLQPVLVNRFSRVTLAGFDAPERVTLDFGLAYAAGGAEAVNAGVVVAEVKEPGGPRTSAFLRALRDLGAHADGFSKYCVGVSLLYPGNKHNRFKPDLRRMKRISRCDHVRE